MHICDFVYRRMYTTLCMHRNGIKHHIKGKMMNVFYVIINLGWVRENEYKAVIVQYYILDKCLLIKEEYILELD